MCWLFWLLLVTCELVLARPQADREYYGKYPVAAPVGAGGSGTYGSAVGSVKSHHSRVPAQTPVGFQQYRRAAGSRKRGGPKFSGKGGFMRAAKVIAPLLKMLMKRMG